VFFWSVTLYFYLRASREQSSRWIVGLFLASVAATMTKTQGLLFPGLLIIGRVMDLWFRSVAGVHEPRLRMKIKKIVADDILWALGLSLIPIALYIVTHPGIPATLLLYGGTMYGLSGIAERITTQINVWWMILLLLLPLALWSTATLKRLPWSVWALLLIGTTIGIVLGPDHPYYSSKLIFWSLPIGVLLGSFSPRRTSVVLAMLMINAFAITGPETINPSPTIYPLFNTRGYWNGHAERIDATMQDTDMVFAIGYPGHHIRWYLSPRIVVANSFDPETTHGTILLLEKKFFDRFSDAEILYEDERLMVMRR
jgi:hypothetical protein